MLRFTHIACIASLFLIAEVIENTQTHNNDLVIVPISTVFKAVQALVKY